jgi:RNA polymerase sigma-70 factor (ECF subfamily)
MRDEATGPEPEPTRTPEPDGAPGRARRAFDAFYREEVDGLYRAMAVTLGDHHVAREAVDEAMARACARWRTVGGYAAPAGWVYRVALNWARSRWRKLHREERYEPPADDNPTAAASAAAVTNPTVAGPEPPGGPALAALAGLPLDQRAVVVCRVLLDLDTAGTAAALRIREGTARSRLSRGLATLRHEIRHLEEDDR